MSGPFNTDLRFGAPPNISPFYQVSSPSKTDLRFNNPNVLPVFVENASPNVFNILASGVVGDGVTDDTAAYQAALTSAAGAGGGIVYHPPNVVAGISSTLVCNSDNVMLVGGGWSSQVKALAGLGANPMYSVAGPGGAGNFRYGISVSDIFFNGNNVAGAGGIQFNSTYHALIQHVRVRFCLGIGIDLEGIVGAFGAYTRIMASTISDGGAGVGVLTNNHEYNMLAENVIVFFNGAGGIGVKLQNGNNLVAGNTLDECDTGIWTSANNNTIANNQFDRGLTRFIYLHASKFHRIIGNYFGTFAGAGNQSIIVCDNGGNRSNLIANNQVSPFGTQWSSFANENGMGAGGAPGNLYVNNDTLNLPSTLVSGTMRGNPTYNPVTALPAPATPVPTTQATGGTIAAGTYQAIITFTNAFGETVGSAAGSVVTTGATSTITVPLPKQTGNATGWYVYLTQVNGAVFTRQQAAGSPLSFTSDYVLTTPPTNTGANPPGANTTAGFAQPAVPATGVSYFNAFGVDATVYVTGGTVTAIAINGVTTGVTSGMVRVPSRATITLTYSVAPTWQWLGE